MTVVMDTKTNLAIIAIVAAFVLVTAGSFVAPALAAKTTYKAYKGASADKGANPTSTLGIPKTSSFYAQDSTPQKTRDTNSYVVTNSDEGANPSSTGGSKKQRDAATNSDEGAKPSSTGTSSKDLKKLQSCISEAARGPEGLSRNVVDICYDQTFYGSAPNSGVEFNPRY